MSLTRSAGIPGSLQLEFFDPVSRTIVAGATLATAPNVDWIEQSFELRSGARPPVVRFRATQMVDISIAWLNIIEDGALMDFDTHDKRYHWRNDNNGLRAFVLPNGRGDRVDWAGYVGRDPAQRGTGWPMRNRQLALVRNRSYRICFYVKRVGNMQPSTVAWGTARLKSTSQSGLDKLAGIDFKPTDNWQEYCL